MTFYIKSNDVNLKIVVILFLGLGISKCFRPTCERNGIFADLVVLVGLKIGQGGIAGSGERHDFDTSIHQALVI